jgi:hypothetical protein
MYHMELGHPYSKKMVRPAVAVGVLYCSCLRNV